MPRRGRLDDELRGEIDLSLRRERLFAQLATLLGGVTLLLATVGLYGLLAYSVTRRMPELGLRMALGASRGTVRWMVMKQSLLLVGAGLVIGIPAARRHARGVTAGRLRARTPRLARRPGDRAEGGMTRGSGFGIGIRDRDKGLG